MLVVLTFNICCYNNVNNFALVPESVVVESCVKPSIGSQCLALAEYLRTIDFNYNHSCSELTTLIKLNKHEPSQ